MLVNNIFNNIKIHTQYSICEGAIKIDELAEYCKAKKIRCLGLADNYNLCGALEFSEKLSKAGTQPIIGTQINLKEDNIIGKITLYAKTEDGYKNLTKLSSLSYLKSNEDEEPACSLTDLIKNNKDLILFDLQYIARSSILIAPSQIEYCVCIFILLKVLLLASTHTFYITV